METLVGVFRCFLPVRYWEETRRGAALSIWFTWMAGTLLGIWGLLRYSARVSAVTGKALLESGGASESQVMGLGGLDAFGFFMMTPIGWLADYLFISAMVRGLALAADSPWGDPILTVIDWGIQDKRDVHQARKDAEARELAEGPAVPDQVLECRKFAGKEADFVVVSSRRKDGWTLATTVIVGNVRLRLGDPLEKTLEGKLRTCYPLKVIRDIQVDRRVVYYDWPKDAPPLPEVDGSGDVWAPPVIEGDDKAPASTEE